MKTQTDIGIELTGTPEELGKAIYWFVCGKKEEDK